MCAGTGDCTLFCHLLAFSSGFSSLILPPPPPSACVSERGGWLIAGRALTQALPCADAASTHQPVSTWLDVGRPKAPQPAHHTRILDHGLTATPQRVHQRRKRSAPLLSRARVQSYARPGRRPHKTLRRPGRCTYRIHVDALPLERPCRLQWKHPPPVSSPGPSRAHGCGRICGRSLLHSPSGSSCSARPWPCWCAGGPAS